MLAESLILGAAAYRLWRLIAEDNVSEPLRDFVIRRDWTAELVECPWCLGSWLTVAVGVAAWSLGWIDGSPWLVVPAAAVVCGALGDWL